MSFFSRLMSVFRADVFEPSSSDASPWKGERATNRQRKVLRFFEVKFPSGITKGRAGILIDGIFGAPGNRHRWEQYCELTGDHKPEGRDNDTDELLPHNPADLLNVIVPPKGKRDPKKSREDMEEIIHSHIKESGVFSNPLPAVIFPNRTFVLTGKFQHGTKENYRKRIEAKGGNCANQVGYQTHYLVVGDKGNENWKFREKGRKYGTKTVQAKRLVSDGAEIGIIPETHLRKHL